MVGSQLNSTMLSCEGSTRGSITPTDSGTSAGTRWQVGSKAQPSPSTRPSEPESGPEVSGPSPFTDVQDAVPWPAPPPPIQLLLLCVLQASVMENHTYHTLWAQKSMAHRSEGAWAFGNQFPQLGQANHPALLTPPCFLPSGDRRT